MMHWPYEYVQELPSEVYQELLAMLVEEAQRTKVPDGEVVT